VTVPLHVDVSGVCDASTVVLVPGLSAHGGAWAAVAPVLGREFRVAVVDNRDAGRSPRVTSPYTVEDMADDLAAAVADLVAPGERVGLLGQSMGSSIAIAAAAHHPELVGALVAVVPPVRVDQFLRRTLSTYARLAEWLDRADLAELALLAGMSRDTFERRPDMVDLAVKAMADDPLAQEPVAYARQIDALLAMDLAPLLPLVAAPTRVLSGVADHLVSADDSREIAAGIPNAELVCLHDAAHAVAADAPIAYLDLVVGHFRRHLAA